MIGSQPACLKCKHLISPKDPPHCKAFPEGIPDIIWVDGDEHSEAYPGDNGIMFEKV